MRAYRLAYDGRPFHGFQRQPEVATVEDALLDALRALGVLGPDADVPRGYSAAGRTDAGVSALAQTVAFEAPDWCGPRALNGELPGAVRAWASTDVPPAFHATHDATHRAYVYHLPLPAGSDPTGPSVDPALERARDAAARLSGEHDVHNLTPDDRGTVRDLAVAVDRDGEFLVLTVESDGFPRHLVRRLASLVGAVASDDATAPTVDRVLSPEPLEGPAGVPAAPAEGLVLTRVDYPDASFAVDDDAVDDARAAFEDRAWTARTAARTAERVLDGLGEGRGSGR